MYKDINWVPSKKINQQLVNQYMQDCIQTNHFTNYGPNVKRLEEKVRELLKINSGKSVICVNNATAALHVLCAGIQDRIRKKDFRWATQSFTFPSSVQGFLKGTEIIDIDMEGGLDLEQVNKEEVDGIIITNIFGNVVDIDKYEKWAQENNKILIFDNAASGYSFYKDSNVSNYGTGSIISFHHTKPLGFGEGGAIIVNSEYEKFIRRLINFGFDESNLEKAVRWHPDASNYKMSDVSAIYILQYIQNLEKINQKHQELQKYMFQKVQNIKNIKLYPNFATESLLSCFCFILNYYDDNLRKELIQNKVFCRKYYKPLDNSAIAQKLYYHILCIPCHVNMELKDIDYIVNIIEKFHSNNI